MVSEKIRYPTEKNTDKNNALSSEPTSHGSPNTTSLDHGARIKSGLACLGPERSGFKTQQGDLTAQAGHLLKVIVEIKAYSLKDYKLRRAQYRMSEVLIAFQITRGLAGEL